jgi:hypothetical protein
MSVTPTVLFETPQQEIASMILGCITNSSATSIVTGFATPSGLEAIAGPILARPSLLKTLVVGAANYRAFEALDDLIAGGVSSNRLHVHLGHSSKTGWRKKPFVQFHPMMHSKIYYMEYSDSTASAFIGSHNLTGFAMEGLNGEAGVRLDGLKSSPEFEKVRKHIATAEAQAVTYSSAMKEAYAWWFREYFEGLKAENSLPTDWLSTRTILIFAVAARGQRPKPGDHIFFEIPSGIEQLTTLKTDVHLFLFDVLPSTPEEALVRASAATARLNCHTDGGDNDKGYIEVTADWHIDRTPQPVLTPIPGSFRPLRRSGMQQVKAVVDASEVDRFEYRFDRERTDWDVELSSTEEVQPTRERAHGLLKLEDRRAEKDVRRYNLVRGLTRRSEPAFEKDQAALNFARPESGAFILVALQRRKSEQFRDLERKDS